MIIWEVRESCAFCVEKKCNRSVWLKFCVLRNFNNMIPLCRNRCGFPRVNTTSPVHLLSTGSASKSMLFFFNSEFHFPLPLLVGFSLFVLCFMWRTQLLDLTLRSTDAELVMQYLLVFNYLCLQLCFSFSRMFVVGEWLWWFYFSPSIFLFFFF